MLNVKAIQEKRIYKEDKLEIVILLIKSEALLSIEKKLSKWLDELVNAHRDDEADTEYSDILYKKYNTHNKEIRLLLLKKYGIEL